MNWKFGAGLCVVLYAVACGGADDAGDEGVVDAAVTIEEPDVEGDEGEVEEGVTIIRAEKGSFVFEPASVVIAEGDTVRFELGAGHAVAQVDYEAWQKLNATPLEGGFYFELNSGGGDVVFEVPGTFYFISMAYAEMEMRGEIVVE